MISYDFFSVTVLSCLLKCLTISASINSNLGSGGHAHISTSIFGQNQFARTLNEVVILHLGFQEQNFLVLYKILQKNNQN